MAVVAGTVVWVVGTADGVTVIVMVMVAVAVGVGVVGGVGVVHPAARSRMTARRDRNTGILLSLMTASMPFKGNECFPMHCAGSQDNGGFMHHRGKFYKHEPE
jgi:hypothetical protein